jgi:N-acetylmuramic acid 6-phosphate etherase
MNIDLTKIGTEQRNKNTMDIDQKSTSEILRLINEEDKTVAFAVEAALPQITKVVDAVVESFLNDGRLIYVGAGTSGRLGILDAVECRPTFSVDDEMVQGLLAGGMPAMVKAVEGAEDSIELAIKDLKDIKLAKNDIVIGITASGRTPYAVSGVEYANSIGCLSGCVTTSPNSQIASAAKLPIEAITGAEPVTGSTRMKSGTAQKMICNMISTAAMIKMGKVYQNLMIDVQPTNKKLVKRAQQIIVQAANVSNEVANRELKKYNSVKKAIVAIITGLDNIEETDKLLKDAKGNISIALKLGGK